MRRTSVDDVACLGECLDALRELQCAGLNLHWSQYCDDRLGCVSDPRALRRADLREFFDGIPLEGVEFHPPDGRVTLEPPPPEVDEAARRGGARGGVVLVPGPGSRADQDVEVHGSADGDHEDGGPVEGAAAAPATPATTRTHHRDSDPDARQFRMRGRKQRTVSFTTESPATSEGEFEDDGPSVGATVAWKRDAWSADSRLPTYTVSAREGGGLRRHDPNEVAMITTSRHRCPKGWDHWRSFLAKGIGGISTHWPGLWVARPVTLEELGDSIMPEERRRLAAIKLRNLLRFGVVPCSSWWQCGCASHDITSWAISERARQHGRGQSGQEDGDRWALPLTACADALEITGREVLEVIALERSLRRVDTLTGGYAKIFTTGVSPQSTLSVLLARRQARNPAGTRAVICNSRTRLAARVRRKKDVV